MLKPPRHGLLGVRVEQLGFDTVCLADHFYDEVAWGLETPHTSCGRSTLGHVD
jgi:hypothetical protein